MNEETEKKSKIRIAQVVASALAALTAAFLGGQLGVYGTVVGAGLISIVTTVGSEFYLRSIERTREAALRGKAVAVARFGRRGEPIQTQMIPVRALDEQDPRADAERTRMISRDELTQHLRDPERTRMISKAALGGRSEQGPEPAPETEPESKLTTLRKLRWPLVIGTSVAAFVIGMLVLTGIEEVTGTAASGGAGTTLGHLGGGGGSPGSKPDQPQTPTPAPESGQPTSGPSPTSDAQQPNPVPPTTTTAPTTTTTAPPTTTTAPPTTTRARGVLPTPTPTP